MATKKENVSSPMPDNRAARESEAASYLNC
jgi:hypothetical protein